MEKPSWAVTGGFGAAFGCCPATLKLVVRVASPATNDLRDG